MDFKHHVYLLWRRHGRDKARQETEQDNQANTKKRQRKAKKDTNKTKTRQRQRKAALNKM